MARILASIIVAVAHVVLFFLFSAGIRLPPLSRADAERPPEMVVFFLPSDEEAETPPPAEEAVTLARSSEPAQRSLRTRAAESEGATTHRSSGASEPRSVEPSAEDEASSGAITPPPAIDWAREAEIVARDRIAADEEARRLASALTRHKDAGKGRLDGGLGPDRPRPPEFGWSVAATKRIEPLEGGGTLIRINDRCVIVLSGMILPFCTLEKPPVRGDLFEHMNDPPVLGAE